MLQPPQKVGVVVVNSKAERLAPGPEIKPWERVARVGPSIFWPNFLLKVIKFAQPKLSQPNLAKLTNPIDT
jgi:hypothetical protein